jgi:hypothetical protein
MHNMRIKPMKYAKYALLILNFLTRHCILQILARSAINWEHTEQYAISPTSGP